ncbi:MAG: carbohydrate binding family 9 domain-containing protein [Balneolaceae bacterium]|nr:carbohydrate binding family 9 domain-containing protein [Balneolaceae bacterium]MBO6547193.1 carbohydrate binding family 9 domain-containing protein [Balneolaceae bacterium]MBO6647860.1 carbohydrate binding family 9 domain-containing protein [Balneolaceae bacterium]
MKNTPSVFIVTAIVTFALSHNVNAQSVSAKPAIEAKRVSMDNLIQIDGILNESDWQSADIAKDFIQNFPVDGGKPSQRTEIRVLYSDKYLYVGAFNYDTAPDSITSTLFRRDGDELSDWIFVSIDSYNDNRTAFTFGVNPKGVQKDIMFFNDVEEDILWDAVWDAQTTINSEGWIAEFRIPLSQLRFTSSRNEQTWGINFERQIARYDEFNYWARIPREENGEVSFFGDLEGIKDLSRPLRLEIVPYVSGELKREPDLNNSNPFYEQNEFTVKTGGDFKYGITSDFTLTGTINPDFGQVEADPATINLTVFEDFFAEQRPFFLEGSDIFAFGSTTSQNTFSSHINFYSRRIGKDPIGQTFQAGINSTFEDRPSETTIAGAAKVSGKTEKGLSLGVLNAYTLEEKSEFFFSGDNSEGTYTIEPSTNYLVTRIRQDLKDGDAQVGGFISAVNRSMNGSYLENYLNESAYQAGVDGQYFWANRNWGAGGVLAFSQVNGTENSILNTQTTSARYYNRIDSDYLSVDSTKTSLNGYFGEFSIGKYSGAGLRYSFTYSEMSPGYEVNDIGFLERADYRAPHLYAEYLNVSSDMFRFYLLWAYGGYAWNFDGDMIMNFYSSGAYFQLNNLWTILGTAGFTGQFYDDRSSRGGAVLKRPRDWSSSLEITSNSTKNFYATLGGSYRRDTSGEFTSSIYTNIYYRPASFIQLSVSPTFFKEKSTNEKPEFFDGFESDTYGTLFSEADLDIFFTEFRLNWTFSSKLSLQTYARPLIYSADFYNFKFFNQSKTYNFTPLGDITDQATVDNFNSSFDFDFRTIQGNAVLRYEYRPGSTIFLVWQQERENLGFGNSRFTPLESSVDIFSDDPINIFLIKFSYWFGS